MTDWSDTLPRTQALIEQGLSDGLHIGGQFYISRNGETVSNFAFGQAKSGHSMQADTLMIWASASKPVTAVAIAQLFEKDRLHLDDLVSRFIPEFARNGKETITLRHLLTHTAGFRAADKVPESLAWMDKLARIDETPIEAGWVPGEKAGYQMASSWYILAEIVQRIDGRRFEYYVRDEIFLPLGLRDSWIGMPLEQYQAYGNRMGVMHSTEKTPPTPHAIWEGAENATACRPGSNGRGPVQELGRFYETLLNGGSQDGAQLLQPDTVRLFTSRHRIGMFDHTFLHKIDWGLGFIINSNRYGVETVPYGYGRHASDETFGHSGSQSSCAFADPRHSLVVAWVFNGMPGERRHQKRAREINSAIYEDLGLKGTE